MTFPVYAPDNNPVGLAIRLDKDSDPDIIQRLAVVNKGYVPQYDTAFHGGEYFVLLFDPKEPNLVIPGVQFDKRWAFAGIPSDYWMTPIIEL